MASRQCFKPQRIQNVLSPGRLNHLMMTNRQQTGKYGEALAATWLMNKGFEIIMQNWKSGRYEIDIVARKDNIIHAIEVKTRRTFTYGYPEASITSSKQNSLVAAAAALIEHYHYEALQINVLSIVIKNRIVDYYFIEDIC